MAYDKQSTDNCQTGPGFPKGSIAVPAQDKPKLNGGTVESGVPTFKQLGV